MPVKTLPPKVREYYCFKKYGKSAHSEQCSKSHVLTKVIDKILDIDSFDKQYVILKILLQSERLKNMVTIGVD